MPKDDAVFIDSCEPAPGFRCTGLLQTELIRTLKGGALAAGFASELWTLPRIASLIKERFGVELSQPSVWRMLQQLGWSVQRPTAQA